jgi:hypothetical protein
VQAGYLHILEPLLDQSLSIGTDKPRHRMHLFVLIQFLKKRLIIIELRAQNPIRRSSDQPRIKSNFLPSEIAIQLLDTFVKMWKWGLYLIS